MLLARHPLSARQTPGQPADRQLPGAQDHIRAAARRADRLHVTLYRCDSNEHSALSNSLWLSLSGLLFLRSIFIECTSTYI